MFLNVGWGILISICGLFDYKIVSYRVGKYLDILEEEDYSITLLGPCYSNSVQRRSDSGSVGFRGLRAPSMHSSSGDRTLPRRTAGRGGGQEDRAAQASHSVHVHAGASRVGLQVLPLFRTCENSMVKFGDDFVQIGPWRIAEHDSAAGTSHSGTSLVMSNKRGLVIVYGNSGTVHPSPNTHKSTWDRPLNPSPKNIKFGDRFLQIGRWRLCNFGSNYASICNDRGQVSVGYDYSDPENSPRNRCCHNRPIDLTHPNAPKIGGRYIEIGESRWADMNFNHFSVSLLGNGRWQASLIYRDVNYGGPLVSGKKERYLAS